MFTRKNKALLLQVFFLVIFFQNLHAQDPLLKHYTTNDGLSSITVYSLLQDKDGYIWFGTDVGVSRFDGKRFQNYSISDGLSDNYIITVKSDLQGRVWFMGFNGTVSYWWNGKIFNSTTDTALKNIITTTSFMDFFEDEQHKRWFVSQNEFVVQDKNIIYRPDSDLLMSQGIVINGKHGQVVVNQGHGYTMPLGALIINRINFRYNTKMNCGYTRIPGNGVLFVSKNGLIRQYDTSQTLLIPFPVEYTSPQQPGVAVSNDSLVWITATGRGVYCYNLNNPKQKPDVFLKGKMTASVLADREGNIWISTLNDGLYMIPEWGRKVNIFNKENGLSDNHAYAIHKLNTGDLLVGMNNGETNVISKDHISILNIPMTENEPNKVQHILSSGDDTWIASDRDLVHLNKKTGCNHSLTVRTSPDAPEIPISSVKDMALGNNRLYIVSGFNVIEYPQHCNQSAVNLRKLVSEKPVRTYSVFSDHAGEIWYGTKTGLQSKKEDVFIDHSNENSLFTRRINAIAETEDSTLVLATYGYGVVFYKDGKIVKHISTSDGLVSDICRRIFIHRDKIYICTPSGVSVIIYRNSKVESVIGMNTGSFLPSNDVNDIFATDSDIYIATIEGVAILGNWALTKIRPDIPQLNLSEVRVNDSIIPVDAYSSLRFPYYKNSFKFSFIGICFQMPDEVSYRYRLKDDQVWQFTGNTSLDFSFLSPGDYHFQVQARIQNGEWSPVKSVLFNIALPFWEKPWFLLIILITGGSLIYFLVRLRVENLKKRKEEKVRLEKQISQLEQQALQALMNPHFIFNVMNSIQHFINANDKSAANRYLSNFAKLIRMNLTISLKSYITLEEEIGYLKLYLSFEKLRFGDNLNYEIVIDPVIDISQTKVAVMMIQPFLENAIWHGILPLNAKGHIRLVIEKESDSLLHIMIEDNGIGISEQLIGTNLLTEKSESHALSMTMQRLILMGKTSGQELYINYKHADITRMNKGTIAEIMLPAKFY
jgi:ligand-binding sensor domain-containing protein